MTGAMGEVAIGRCRDGSCWQPRCHRNSLRPVALRPRLSTGVPFYIRFTIVSQAGSECQRTTDRLPDYVQAQVVHMCTLRARAHVIRSRRSVCR